MEQMTREGLRKMPLQELSKNFIRHTEIIKDVMELLVITSRHNALGEVKQGSLTTLLEDAVKRMELLQKIYDETRERLSNLEQSMEQKEPHQLDEGKITGLWNETNAQGKTYLSGNLNSFGKVYVISNPFKKQDNDPECFLYLKPSAPSVKGSSPFSTRETA